MGLNRRNYAAEGHPLEPLLTGQSGHAQLVSWSKQPQDRVPPRMRARIFSRKAAWTASSTNRSSASSAMYKWNRS
jgi:hypothetical protein